jgi:hypothetical protein
MGVRGVPPIFLFFFLFLPFEACISDNVMQRKRGRENPGKSSNDSEKSASKGLEDISTKAAADKFKRLKRLKV